MPTQKATKSNAKKYERQWDVPSESDPSSYYTVSLTREGEYVCHCWPFLRQPDRPCKHIRQVQQGRIPPRGTPGVKADRAAGPQSDTAAEITAHEPRIILCNVRCVTPISNADRTEVIELKTPPVQFGVHDDQLVLTVLYDLARYGVSWDTLRKQFKPERSLTLNWVQDFIQNNGRVIFGPWQDGLGFAGVEYIPPEQVR